MTRGVLFFMFVAFASTGLSAQQKVGVAKNYVDIRGIRLSLGMSYKQVATALKPQNLYAVKGGEDDWFILDGPALSKTAHSFGLLSFNQEGLTSIRKSWNLNDQQSTSEEVLFYLIDTFVQEDKRHCVLSTKHVDSVEEESKTVWIVCGEKRIVVSYFKSKTQDGVMIRGVDEILSR